MNRRAAVLLYAVFALGSSGCSALILATGTPEEELIRPGDTRETLVSRLGLPVRTEVLATPIDTYDLLRKIHPSMLIDHRGRRDSEGNVRFPEATAIAEYKFEGRLKRRHDVGETVSVNLMTFGLFEPFALPYAIAERSRARTYILRVWFDRKDTAMAYVWCRSDTECW